MGLADTFKEMRGPLVGDFLKRVRSRFLDHTVEVPQGNFTRLRSDRRRVAVDGKLATLFDGPPSLH